MKYELRLKLPFCVDKTYLKLGFFAEFATFDVRKVVVRKSRVQGRNQIEQGFP